MILGSLLEVPYPTAAPTARAVHEPEPTAPLPPRLLDRVRIALRARHGSRRTEKAYVGNVLEIDLPWLDDVVRAKRPERLPVVLTREEVRAVIQGLHGTPRLMAVLMYGAGLRLLECARLRVKDVDFATNQIIVRSGKGDKDRVTMLPAVVTMDLAAHLQTVRVQHQADLLHGAGWVELPWALARKYPNAGREWAWQWVFPATRIYIDRIPASGAGIISTSPSCNARSIRPCAKPASRSQRPATRSATRSPLISWKTATTSAPSRSCWATATSARQ